MNNYHKRHLTQTLEETLRSFPVVILTGARQTGKSTLIQHICGASKRRYLTLDDLDILERAQDEPAALIDSSKEPFSIDEVQRAPKLLHAIKRSVDQKREKGRFLLTGSANLLLLEKVSETLAGRAVFLTLSPMTEREKRNDAEISPWEKLFSAQGIERLCGFRSKAADWRQCVIEGGYPATLGMTQRERLRWFEGYVQSYLERDLRQISAIENLADFRRLMRLAAARLGSLVNQSELARAAGLTQPTAHRYLNILETSYQVVRLSAYAVNRSKRLIKAAKLYWTDPGLACFLTEAADSLALNKLPNLGAHLENLVLREMLSWSQTSVPKASVFYWRTTGGEEVDFVLSWQGKLLPIEVKAASRITPSDCGSLEAFIKEYPESSHGIVLYGGQRVEKITPHVFACPLSLFL
ncbi:MAG: ATP-binding protein [Elusimicrobia bacterium]|nr:ATP-binding protein [Elusimicrobiota bacterium]